MRGSPLRLQAPGTQVVFVRHGQTHNPRQIIYGRLSRFGLSKQGLEDVDRTAGYLASLPLVAVYTSPLLRARQTAARIALLHPGLSVRRCAWLSEVRTSWEGEPKTILDQRQDFTYYDPPRGEADETIEDVFRRMDRALRMVLRRHPGQTTVCVSHGDPIKILRIGYSGKPFGLAQVRAPDPGEASLVILDFWHPDALPIIRTIDLARNGRAISATVEESMPRPRAVTVSPPPR